MARAKRKATEEATVQAMPETKEDKLIRLSGKRVEKACKAIALVGNLAAYRPTPAQIEQIGDCLVEAVNNVQARLQGTRKDSYTFRLERK